MGLIQGDWIGFDVTAVEANVTLPSIVRRYGRDHLPEVLLRLATRPAYKPEHAVDLATGVILAAEIHPRSG